MTKETKTGYEGLAARHEDTREALWTILEALEWQNEAAVEAGDRTLSEAILTQAEALYAEAGRKEKEAERAVGELAQAYSALFLLRLRGAKTRMKHRTERLSTAAAQCTE